MMIRVSFGLLMFAALVGAAGCADIQDGFVEHEICVRNHVLAQQAWCHWSWCYDDLDCPYDFAKGFKAGYREILNGGSGCQPTLPPKNYWKPKYQSIDGTCCINAWFDGYSHGVLAAHQDGVGGVSQIPVSPTARLNLQTQQAHRAPAPHGVPVSGQYLPPQPDMIGNDGYGGGAAGELQPGQLLPAPAEMVAPAPPMQEVPGNVRPYEEDVIPQAGIGIEQEVVEPLRLPAVLAQ